MQNIKKKNNTNRNGRICLDCCKIRNEALWKSINKPKKSSLGKIVFNSLLKNEYKNKGRN